MVKKNILVLSIFFAVAISLAILVWAVPPVYFISPTNTTYANATILVNITTNDTGALTIIWDNGTTTSNLSYTDWIFYNFTYGQHTIIAYANDTATGKNVTRVTFFIDNVYPQFNTLPSNTTILYGSNLSSLNIDFGATDSNLFGAYVVNDTSFSLNQSGYLNNSVLLTPGIIWLNITINDSAGNTNSTKYYVTVSKAVGNITLKINGTAGNFSINRGMAASANNTNITVYMNTPTTSLGGSLKLYLDNGTSAKLLVQNETAVASIGNGSTDSINFTIGHHNVTAIWGGSLNYTGETEVWYVHYDLDVPVITLIAATAVDATTNADWNFTYNVSDVTSDIANCTLFIKSKTGQYSTSITEDVTQEFVETGTLGPGTYSWLVSCTDYVGNQGNSTASTVIITPGETTTTETGGSTGSGGGSEETISPWTNTFAPTDSELVVGYAGSLKAKEKVKIIINSVEHYVGLKSLTSTTASFEIASTPINVTMSVGETKKFDVTGDGYYDIKVTLNSIANSKASVTIQKIYEQIPVADQTVGEQITNAVDKGTTAVKSVDKMTWIIIAVIVIVLIILITLISKSSRKKRYYKKGY
jgi:hypothetical protein